VLVVAILVRLARTAFMLQKAVDNGIRYAVTFEWSDEHCPDGKCTSMVDEQKARLDSINEVVASTLGFESYPDMVAENGWEDLQIVICSNTSGYELTEGGCSPNNFAGEMGSKVFLEINHEHTLVPWIFKDRFKIPLSYSSEGIVDCMSVYLVTRHPLTISLLGNWPDEFTVIAEDNRGFQISINCPSGEVSPSSSNGPKAECKDGEVVFSSYDWEELPVLITEIQADAITYSVDVAPIYEVEYSPSEECYEIQWGNKFVDGTATIELPME